MRRLPLCLLAPLALAAAACEPDAVPVPFRPPPESPREAYMHALEDAGLAGTALGADWAAAGRAALAAPVTVELPYREARYLAPDEPGALAYRFPVRRGQRLEVSVDARSSGPHRIFMELYRAPEGDEPAALVAAAEEGASLLERPIRLSRDYIVRVQPELLRGGRYTVTLRLGPSLSFPVDGRGEDAIQSRFGAPRDGGNRDHHGVDIFAPRGTPALAAAAATVSRVDTTARGGRVVWLRDSEFGQSLYYAHLDRPLVRAGQRVAPGDTVGLIGNTGNARTTPPHLHFGIYSRGPQDPWPYLYRPPGALPAVPDELPALGDWARVEGEGVALRAAPSSEAAATPLPTGAAVRLTGASGSWLAVRTPDGRSGYVARARITQEARPLLSHRLAARAPLLAYPAAAAPVMDSLPAGQELAVLGRHAGFLLVRSGGRDGWLGEAEVALGAAQR
ncbi:MAG TPA: M23 family metallopeptidase [Longimicrobiales bacterium]|nr:M23 family metallopeptidase [Longimicrobiales bacterium]